VSNARIVPFGTKRTQRWIPFASISLPALGWLLFGLFPSLATIFYSLTQYSGTPGTPLDFSGFDNYKEAFTTLLPQLGSSVRVTLVYTAGVTVLQTAAGLGLALMWNKRGKSFTIYRALAFMPEIFSVTVVAAMFLLLFDPYAGPIEPIFKAITGGSSAFFGSQSAALPLAIFVNAWMYSGYSMLIFTAGLRAIPRDVYEASAIDGAGRWRQFWHVTWPLLAPATTVNVWLTAVGSLGQYALILVLTNGNFGTNTLGMYMFTTAFGPSSQLGYGSMIAMLQFFLTLVVGGALLVFLRRREVQL
jgi:raffinose/stachyose/melibiose transport system permease protein